MKQRILMVDDDEGILSALTMLLKSEGFESQAVTSPAKCIDFARQAEFDLILMDLNYSDDTTSGEEGLALIRKIRSFDEFTPIVVMTGWGTIEVAVSAMQHGANDFVQKPWENDRLLAIIQNQTKLAYAQKQSQKLNEQNALLRQEVSRSSKVVCESPAMGRVLATIKQVAKSDVSVLFTGENGTGKSMFARYLHEHSHRAHQSQIAVNMGAVTETLFESEMFGHVKGAFTDAKSTRIGRFELADEGSLFLDEIANTPFSQQAKLLRVLEDSQFEKVGSEKTQTVNIRLITATNSNLTKAVEEGHFRKDLLYRINTIEIAIPSLRERSEDIIPLANGFLRQAAMKYGSEPKRINQAAQDVLLTYSWPGNVRELGHVIERAQILCQSGDIQPMDLGVNPGGHGPVSVEQNTLVNCQDLRSFDEIERDVVKQRMTHFRGDAAKAADSLGWSRSTFYRKLEKSRD